MADRSAGLSFGVGEAVLNAWASFARARDDAAGARPGVDSGLGGGLWAVDAQEASGGYPSYDLPIFAHALAPGNESRFGPNGIVAESANDPAAAAGGGRGGGASSSRAARALRAAAGTAGTSSSASDTLTSSSPESAADSSRYSLSCGSSSPESPKSRRRAQHDAK